MILDSREFDRILNELGVTPSSDSPAMEAIRKALEAFHTDRSLQTARELHWMCDRYLPQLGARSVRDPNSPEVVAVRLLKASVHNFLESRPDSPPLPSPTGFEDALFPELDAIPPSLFSPSWIDRTETPVPAMFETIEQTTNQQPPHSPVPSGTSPPFPCPDCGKRQTRKGGTHKGKQTIECWNSDCPRKTFTLGAPPKPHHSTDRVPCPDCGKTRTTKHGFQKGKQTYKCLTPTCPRINFIKGAAYKKPWNAPGPPCPQCQSTQTRKCGTRDGKQKFQCLNPTCPRKFFTTGATLKKLRDTPSLVCPECQDTQTRKEGFKHGKQKFRCLNPTCPRKFFITGATLRKPKSVSGIPCQNTEKQK